jgi:hypothetical protein
MPTEPETINLNRFMERQDSARADWDALLAQIPEALKTRPGVAGEWSVKDIIAHVTWFEKEMVGLLRSRALAGSELWNLPTDERNAAIYRQNFDRSLEDVLSEAQAVYGELADLLAGLTTEELNDPGKFADMPAEWVPWKLLAENTYEHYRDHKAGIREWLGKADGGRKTKDEG